MILGDSGMGKTTFLVNLYITYKNQLAFPFSMPKYNIRLFPVWHQNTFEDISKIANQENTILLLDAFDEDIAAQKDHKGRLNELLSKTNRFRAILITCRTQFFPSQKEEPHETGYFTAGEKGQYYFQKLYLSVFSNSDVKNYLKKKFSFFQFKNYYKAKTIVSKCPNLVVRPMLLSYIDDLIDSDQSFTFSFQVYEALINSWLKRESKKHGIMERFGSEEAFRGALYSFSEKLAVDLYKKRLERNGFSIPKHENFGEGLLKLSDIENNIFNLTESDGKSKSLLNRNATGDYKFSHKSILEYFLAKEFFNDANMYMTFDFTGMDACQHFFEEILIQNLRMLDGEFYLGGRIRPLRELPTRKFNEILYIKIKMLSNFEPELLKKFNNLKILVLVDFGLMQPIYYLDYLLKIDKQKLSELFPTKVDGQFVSTVGLLRFLKNINNLELDGLIELREMLEMTELKGFDLPELSRLIKKIQNGDSANFENLIEYQFRKIDNRLKLVVNRDSDKLIMSKEQQELKKSTQEFKELMVLLGLKSTKNSQTHFPSTHLTYFVKNLNFIWKNDLAYIKIITEMIGAFEIIKMKKTWMKAEPLASSEKIVYIEKFKKIELLIKGIKGLNMHLPDCNIIYF